jgi:hypothetical protein
MKCVVLKKKTGCGVAACPLQYNLCYEFTYKTIA